MLNIVVNVFLQEYYKKIFVKPLWYIGGSPMRVFKWSRTLDLRENFLGFCYRRDDWTHTWNRHFYNSCWTHAQNVRIGHPFYLAIPSLQLYPISYSCKFRLLFQPLLYHIVNKCSLCHFFFHWKAFQNCWS